MSSTPTPQPSAALEALIGRRRAGADAIGGFAYQFRVAADQILSVLLAEGDDQPHRRIQLEGIEDVDSYRVRVDDAAGKVQRECVQAKYSDRRWDATRFWEKKVLQGFARAFLVDPNLRFRLVHSMPFSEGRMQRLIHASRSGAQLSSGDRRYWKKKFRSYQREAAVRQSDWAGFSVETLAHRIHFEHLPQADLDARIRRRLREDLKVSLETETLYVNALLWTCLEWSKERRSIGVEDLRQLVNTVTQDILRGHDNEVLRKGWVVPVSFEPSSEGEEEAYFEGKAARPFHIASGIPVRREGWERKIMDLFRKNDVTVIRASSGQGKSTLAWQVVHALQQERWTPYEVVWCGDLRDIQHFVDFLKSRIRLGEAPLLVLDGLRPALKDWDELISRTRDLPVKYLVTSREEDWHRFRPSLEKARLRSVSVEMSQEEAEQIYSAFSDRAKIHPNAPEWQVAWERVEDTGLLIEYVFLITRGQMIAERIDTQVGTLAAGPDSRARLALLRLVALADVFGLSLPTEALLQHVDERARFQHDPEAVLASLCDEYYLNREGPASVRGLHPVRSHHLTECLHPASKLSTIRRLISIIRPKDLFEFCAQAPLVLNESDRTQFLEALATHLAGRSCLEMVLVIEGIFNVDAHFHWQANAEIYNRAVINLGQRFKFFISHAFLWSKIDGVLEQIFPEDALQLARELQDILEDFDPTSSLSLQLLQLLPPGFLQESGALSNLKALAHVEFWFHRFGLPSPYVASMDAAAMWNLVETRDIYDLDGLFYMFYRVCPDEYHKLLAAHGPELFERVGAGIQVLSLEAVGADLHMEYFLEPEPGAFSAQSMRRLERAHLFFPAYARYCAQGLYPPSKLVDVFWSYSDDSPKYISRKRMDDGHAFNVRMNALWMNTIARQYESGSLYEWQRDWFCLRQACLELIQIIYHLVDARLRGRAANVNKHVASVDEFRPQVLQALRRIPQLRNSRNVNEVNPFQQEQADLFRWGGAYSNFLGNLDSILLGRADADMHLDLFGKLVEQYLGPLQDSYQKILHHTSAHFDTTTLDEHEWKWYRRLEQLLRYFLAHYPPGQPVDNPLDMARRWVERQDGNRLKAIQEVFDVMEAKWGVSLLLGTEIIHDPPLKIAVVGWCVGDFLPQVAGGVPHDFRELPLDVLEPFFDLLEVDVDAFYVYLLDEEKRSLPMYVCISKTHIAQLKLIFDGEAEEDSLRPPMPRFLESEHLDVLPGVTQLMSPDDAIAEVYADFVKLFQVIWRLKGVWRELSKRPDSEWLKQLESRYDGAAAEALAALKAVDAEYPFLEHVPRLEAMLEGREPVSDEVLREMDAVF